jgi:DNA-binding PadR family transcriptional regulator
MPNDYGCGCDMRGLLSFQILWLLSKKSMCGDSVAEEIGRRRGEKPKAGTIYPALKELRMGRLISGKKNGKTIVYSLTPKGVLVVRKATRYFVHSFGDIITTQ